MYAVVVFFVCFVCLCVWQRESLKRRKPKKRSVEDRLYFHMWVCVSGYVCVSDFSDLSVERLHVCLLWALWLKEHGATYLAVMCRREMPLMSATHVQHKREGWHICIENTTFKIHYASQAPLITLTLQECVYASVSAYSMCMRAACRRPEEESALAHVSHTHLWYKPSSCLFQFPPCKHCRVCLVEENVLHMSQTQPVLLGIYVKLGKRSRTWHVIDSFFCFAGTRLKSLLYYH